MVEAALSAGALLDLVLAPAPGKQGALLAQAVDQGRELQIVDMAAGIGAEFRQHAARPLLPVGQDLPCERAQEDIAQQIAVVLPVEPADEQTLGLASFQARAFQTRSST